ncbi:hypothetical protein V8E54_006834 [Elaphomyces granulatus]
MPVSHSGLVIISSTWRRPFITGTAIQGKIKRRPSNEYQGQQAAAFKKPRLVPDKHYSKLAERARELRKDMVKSFTQFSDIASQFADPAFHAKLLLPSVFSSLPKRFEIDSEHKWFTSEEKSLQIL